MSSTNCMTVEALGASTWKPWRPLRGSPGGVHVEALEASTLTPSHFLRCSLGGVDVEALDTSLTLERFTFTLHSYSPLLLSALTLHSYSPLLLAACFHSGGNHSSLCLPRSSDTRVFENPNAIGTICLHKLRNARAWETQRHTSVTSSGQNALRESRRPPWEKSTMLQRQRRR